MATHSRAEMEHWQAIALYQELLEFFQAHKIDDIDRMVMDGTFAAEWPDIDASAPLADLPKWREREPADPARVRLLGHGERNLAPLGNLRVHLRQLTEIPEALARELAKVLDVARARDLEKKAALAKKKAAQQKQAAWKRALAAYQRKWEQDYERNRLPVERNRKKRAKEQTKAKPAQTPAAPSK